MGFKHARKKMIKLDHMYEQYGQSIYFHKNKNKYTSNNHFVNLEVLFNL